MLPDRMQDISMRVISALVLLLAGTVPALAGDGFHIVLPGRPGVPIIINGINASYAVVEGDWGLARNVHVQPTVYGGRYIDPQPNVGHYYPSAGRMPGYGRLEIEPPKDRKLPKAAESFHESWSAQSAPPAAQNPIPFEPPPVIEAPRYGAPGLPRRRGSNPRNDRN
jgi:hypothetical protein